VEAIPVNQAGGAKQFMLLIEEIQKQGFEHKKLPFWNMYFHIKYLWHILQKETSINPQISSVFKEQYQYLRGFQPAFFRTN